VASVSHSRRHPRRRRVDARHRCRRMVSLTTACSWPDKTRTPTELWFAKIEQDVITRGIFKSVPGPDTISAVTVH
jgi:hypothetical protein